jgi:hypothetical protein
MNFLRNAILGDSNTDTNNIQRKNSNTKQKNLRQRRNFDEYDDDDDWGMTALSATQASLQRYGYATKDMNIGDSTDSNRSPFWDQSSVGEDPVSRRGGGGGGGEMMQSWEKASLYQDQMENAFSIGDDDYYSSDQRSLEEDKKAYDEVQEDLRTVEDEAEEGSVSSNKEDVANAYRDYLKSIREGGFETYLNADDEDETPDFDHMAFGDDNKQTPVVTDKKSGERVLEIEEDRSLYGGLYGVRDMRAQDSPYTSWRAKAQALVDYDNQRQRSNSQSPLRNGVGRFRRKSPMNVDSGRDFEEEMMTRRGHYNYPLLHSGRFKRFCFCSVVMFALAIGLYNSAFHRSSQESSQISVPPKTEASPEQQHHEDPNLYVPPKASNAIANTLKTFDPVWYDRKSGWEGITFKDAVNFCNAKEKRVPCSYELYCEDGPGLPPYEGVKLNGEQWAAISNGPNQWVQVGTIANDPTHTCTTYKQMFDELPKWGVTGISTEHAHGAGGITQNLMCCYNANHLSADWWYFDDEADAEEAGEQAQEVGASAVGQDNTATETTDTTAVEDTNGVDQAMNDPSDGNVAVVSDNIKIQQREKAVIAAFQPIWFASSHGWDGSTYDAAVDFCDSYDHMVLCPFSAYCPNGPGSPPLSGSMVLELDGEEWAPVNGPPNSWVQLGTISGEPNSRCALYHDLLGNRPQWGLDGSKPELKHHIMCCLM